MDSCLDKELGGLVAIHFGSVVQIFFGHAVKRDLMVFYKP